MPIYSDFSSRDIQRATDWHKLNTLEKQIGFSNSVPKISDTEFLSLIQKPKSNHINLSFRLWIEPVPQL